MDEKKALEISAVKYFIAAFKKQNHIDYKIVQHQDRPDIIIEDRNTKKRLGVEVTHLFYDSQEARIILGRAKDQVHGPETIDQYILRLNQLLQQKADKAKGYQCNNDNILLVRVVSPVFDIDDFNASAEKIVVPVCLYKNIWLLFYDFDHNYWGILKLLK